MPGNLAWRFDGRDFEAAFKHLGLTSDERQRVSHLRRELALELGLEWKTGVRA